jgi:hypothetical protein
MKLYVEITGQFVPFFCGHNFKTLTFAAMTKYLILLLLLGACSTNQTHESNKAAELEPVVKIDSAQQIIDTVNVSEKISLPQINDSLNAIAQVISGSYSGSLYSEITASKSYNDFSEAFTKRWNDFDSSRIQLLTQFRENELDKNIQSEPNLFYPFSGPDILYANTFFPSVNKFILIGLEPVGTLPDFTKTAADSLDPYFNKVNTSLNAILKFSFFRTNSMSKDLKNTEVNGTIHLLFLFLSRTGNDLISAKPITVDSIGTKQYLNSFEELKASHQKTKGVEIVFKSPDDKIKELNYFSLDLSNEGLMKNKGFKTYLDSLQHFNTYLKGASYLLHRTYFSTVRDLILNSTSTVVQDDSGIALRYFKKGDDIWDYKLYGTYTKPVSLFRNLYQKDLDTLYKKNGSTNLGFGIGYNFKDKNSNLMIFKRKLNS